MKSCYGCKTQFEPKKHFHYLCDDCIKVATKCGKCSKTVLPKNGVYSHCGVTEKQDKVEYVNRHNAAAERRMSQAIFGATFGIIEKHGMHVLEDYMGVYDE